MVLLDKLLPKLKERDSRVLIFSQVSCFNLIYAFKILLGTVCFYAFIYSIKLNTVFFCGFGTFYLKFR